MAFVPGAGPTWPLVVGAVLAVLGILLGLAALFGVSM
jgi:hypothetical protein